MASFEEREKGFEAKYKQDQERQFKVMARRNRLLGLWAAGLLGMTGEAAETYAKGVVTADFEKPGDDDVVHHILRSFKERGIEMTEHKVRHEMNRFMSEAEAQINAGTKG
ncbi:MAG: DUF1476 domain-containing protein [Alphaproteobacteria bacterium]